MQEVQVVQEVQCSGGGFSVSYTGRRQEAPGRTGPAGEVSGCRRTGAQEDRRTGGQEDRRTGGQEDRRSLTFRQGLLAVSTGEAGSVVIPGDYIIYIYIIYIYIILYFYNLSYIS